MTLKELQTLVTDMFRTLGVLVTIEYDAEPYIGDETLEPGSFTIDGWLAVYPSRDEASQPGFALDRIVVTPGMRTLRNGDPGYPDETDALNIYPCMSPNCELMNNIVLERVAEQVVRRRVVDWQEWRKEEAMLSGHP